MIYRISVTSVIHKYPFFSETLKQGCLQAGVRSNFSNYSCQASFKSTRPYISYTEVFAPDTEAGCIDYIRLFN